MYKKKIINLLMIITLMVVSIIVFIQIHNHNYIEKLSLNSKTIEESQKLFQELEEITVNNPDKSIEEATIKLENENNDIKRGIYNEIIGRAYVKKYDKENYDKYFNNAIKIYEKVDNGEKFQFKLNLFLINLGMVEGDYIKSADYCHKVLDIIDNSEIKYINDDDIAQAKSLILVIALKTFLEDKFKEKANTYYEEINKINKESNVYLKYKDMFLYSKYLYEMEIGNYSKANNTIEELNYLANKNEIKSEFLCRESIRLNLIRTKIKMGHKTESIAELGTIIKNFELYKNTYYLGLCYLTYGDYYEILESYDKAKVNYDKAIKYFEEAKYERGIIRSCENIIKINENKKEFNDISKYYTEYFKYMNFIEDNDTLKLLMNDLNIVNKELGRIKTRKLYKEKIDIENKHNKMKKIIFGLLIIIINMTFILYNLCNQVHKRIKKEEQLKASLNIDYLTKSYTKAYGYEKIEKLMKDEENFYLAIIDLDNFKVINDTYGHVFGDRVLSCISQNIRNSLEEGDFLVRFGGEEFMIVIINKTKEEVKEKLEEIRSNIEAMKWGRELKTTISIGVTKYIQGDLKSFLNEVDELLYIAKNSGKNKVEVGKILI